MVVVLNDPTGSDKEIDLEIVQSEDEKGKYTMVTSFRDGNSNVFEMEVIVDLLRAGSNPA